MKKSLSVSITILILSLSSVCGQEDPISKYFPEFNVIETNSPFDGYFFMAAQGVNTASGKLYIAIVDNHGTPVFFRFMPKASVGMKLLDDGTIGYAHGVPRKLYLMDDMLNVTDTMSTVGGKLDAHDWAINDKGDYHRLLFMQYNRVVDMSQVVEGGNTEAEINEFSIQEFDENNNLLHRWKTEDIFNVLDGNEESSFVDFTEASIDYAHLNGIAFFSDTSLVVSTRHMDEITCIDRRTGEIIWRLGGKNNQFTFINDTVGFSHQHCPRKLDNGNLLLFDNGNWHQPARSSAVEYKIDTENMTATLVNRYRRTPDSFAPRNGSVQRLENGNTLVTWGPDWPSFTEFHPDGTVALEIDITEHSYCPRVYKYAWKTSVFETSAENLDFGIYDGSTPVESTIQLKNNCDTVIQITGAEFRTTHFSVSTPLPLSLEPGTWTDITLQFEPQSTDAGYLKDVVTLAVDNASQRVARQVTLEGRQQDDTAPELIIMPDSSNVPIDSFVVTMQFSEPVRNSDQTAIEHQELTDLVIFRITDENGEDVPFKATINTDKTFISVIPDTSLKNGTTYFIGLSDPLQDYSGNALEMTSQTFTTVSIVSVKEYMVESMLKIYPNPSKGFFTIQTDYTDKASLEIYSVAGHLILRKDISHATASIDAGDAPAGMYYLILRDEHKVIIGRTKLVIQ